MTGTHSIGRLGDCRIDCTIALTQIHSPRQPLESEKTGRKGTDKNLIPLGIPLSRRQLGLVAIAIAAISAMITPFLMHPPSQTQATIPPPTTPGPNGNNGDTNSNGGSQGTSTATGTKHSGKDSDTDTETGDSGSDAGHPDNDDANDAGSHSTHTGHQGNDDQSAKVHSHTEHSQPDDDAADSIHANKQSIQGTATEQHLGHHGQNDDRDQDDEGGS